MSYVYVAYVYVLLATLSVFFFRMESFDSGETYSIMQHQQSVSLITLILYVVSLERFYCTV